MAISLSHAGLIHPYLGQELNSIHILFEWDQEPDAIEYNLQISNSDSFNNILLDKNDSQIRFVCSSLYPRDQFFPGFFP